MSANDKVAATFHGPRDRVTAVKLFDAIEQLDIALSFQVPSIDLAARLADLNTAARAHIDRLAFIERERVARQTPPEGLGFTVRELG